MGGGGYSADIKVTGSRKVRRVCRKSFGVLFYGLMTLGCKLILVVTYNICFLRYISFPFDSKDVFLGYSFDA